MDARIDTIYNWSSVKVKKILEEILEIELYIPEVKRVKLCQENSTKEEWFLKLSIEGGKLQNKYLIKLNSLQPCLFAYHISITSKIE